MNKKQDNKLKRCFYKYHNLITKYLGVTHDARPEDYHQNLKDMKKLQESISKIILEKEKLIEEIKKERFGPYIKWARNRLGRKLYDISSCLNMKESVLSDIENCKRNPPNKGILNRLAYELNLDYYLLVDLAEKEKTFAKMGENKKLIQKKDPVS